MINIYKILIYSICIHIIIPMQYILNTCYYSAPMKNRAMIVCKRTPDCK